MNEQAGEFDAAVIACTACPRLVEWREHVATVKTARYKDWTYWGKPVPSFGPPDARLLIVGLAPGAHGSNRTGRMFTSDSSGDLLYPTLYKFGFCTQPKSRSIDDGLRLIDARITAVLHCAPPQNKPATDEIATCRMHMIQELEQITSPAVYVALGGVSFRELMRHFRHLAPKPSPRFEHGGEVLLQNGKRILSCYHPSQQNTSTGRLTAVQFESVFAAARRILDENLYL